MIDFSMEMKIDVFQKGDHVTRLDSRVIPQEVMFQVMDAVEEYLKENKILEENVA
jgi:hypothetical protein